MKTGHFQLSLSASASCATDVDAKNLGPSRVIGPPMSSDNFICSPTLIYTPPSSLILFLLSGILFFSVLSSVSCSLLYSTPRPSRFCGTPPRILPRSAAYLIVTCSRASVSVYRNDCQIIHTPRLNSTGIQLPFFIGHGYSSYCRCHG